VVFKDRTVDTRTLDQMSGAVAISELLQDKTSCHRYVISAAIKRELKTVLREEHGVWRGSLYPDSAGAAETTKGVFPDGV
jgi:hypothetical protein